MEITNVKRAIIKNGIVTNIIMGGDDGIDIGESGAWIGWGYDEETQTFTPPVIPEPTLQELQPQYIKAVSLHLDQKAQERGYDNIVSACSYAAVPGIFQAESIAFAVWRNDIWAYCFNALAQIQAQARSIPTVEELIAELPLFTYTN